MRSRPSRLAFTLLEMLLAVTLSTFLIAAALGVASTLSRDLSAMSRRAEPPAGGAMALLRYDLSNALAIVESAEPGTLILVSSAGLDRKAFSPDWRLSCIQYRVIRQGGESMLIRRQSFLDDPIRTDAWSEVVALDVRRISLIPTAGEPERVRLGEDMDVRVHQALRQAIGSSRFNAQRIPSRARVRIDRATGVEEQEMVLK